MTGLETGPFQPGQPALSRGVVLHANGGPDWAAEGHIGMVTVPVFTDLAAELLQAGNNPFPVGGAATIEMQCLPFRLSEFDRLGAVQQTFVDVPVPHVEAGRLKPRCPPHGAVMRLHRELPPFGAGIDHINVPGVPVEARPGADPLEQLQVLLSPGGVVKVLLLGGSQTESKDLRMIVPRLMAVTGMAGPLMAVTGMIVVVSGGRRGCCRQSQNGGGEHRSSQCRCGSGCGADLHQDTFREVLSRVYFLHTRVTVFCH